MCWNLLWVFYSLYLWRKLRIFVVRLGWLDSCCPLGLVCLWWHWGWSLASLVDVSPPGGPRCWGLYRGYCPCFLLNERSLVFARFVFVQGVEGHAESSLMVWLISMQYEQCNQWPISMQCRLSPVQRHVWLSFKRPRAIDLTLPVKTVPAGKKEECTLIFWTFLRARILPVYGNVRSLTVFPQYGASSSCIGSPGFDNDRCFFYFLVRS